MMCWIKPERKFTKVMDDEYEDTAEYIADLEELCSFQRKRIKLMRRKIRLLEQALAQADEIVELHENVLANETEIIEVFNHLPDPSLN